MIEIWIDIGGRLRDTINFMRVRFPYVRSPRRAWFLSLGASLALHVAGVGMSLLTVWLVAIPPRIPVISTETGPITYQGEWTLRSEFESIDVGAVASTVVEDRSPEVHPGSQELASLIQERLQAEQEKLNAVSPEEVKQKLERMGSRLQAASSATAVDEMTTLLQGVLQVRSGSEPSSPSSESTQSFDFNTAQIDDVRLETHEGQLKYVAIMVDAQGVTLETELDQADGSQLYQTFELMRKFPLMKSVYRGVVMGLMDKMIQQSAALPHADESSNPLTSPPAP